MHNRRRRPWEWSDHTLVSDGYGVYQTWVEHRQTYLTHLIRTARNLAERAQPALVACGAQALAELWPYSQSSAHRVEKGGRGMHGCVS
jgi:hypothetical protein